MIARAEVDVERLHTDIVETLKNHGLDEPEITIRLVDRLEHHKETGKMKRFIPLRQ